MFAAIYPIGVGLSYKFFRHQFKHPIILAASWPVSVPVLGALYSLHLLFKPKSKEDEWLKREREKRGQSFLHRL
jgi:hypothetical protein